MAGHQRREMNGTPTTLLPPRDSLELASLASTSNRDGARESEESSSAGVSSSRNLSFDDPIHPNGDLPRIGRRSYSVSSAFDFNSALFPLSSSGPGYTALGAPSTTHSDPSAQSLEKNKRLTYLNGLSLVVGLIIGSGIFSSPASVNSNAGSPGAALIVWLIAGLLAWTGAASYAELGGAIPLNGGAQVYLSKIFGEWAGFLFTWCAVTVLKPGSAAIVAIIFGEYMVRAPQSLRVADPMNPHPDLSPWINKSVAIAGLVAITLLNCASTKMGVRSADFFMFFKFVGLLAITITGIVVAVTGWSVNADGLSTAWKDTDWFGGTSTSGSQWAVALYAGLWAYDGWDNTNYVVGEMINPARDLPRTIHTSLPIVITGYLLANLSYIFVLPTSVINASNTVAVAFGHTVFGPLGSLFLALTVSGSCFGTLNATTFTAGRLVYSAGKEGYVPSIFATIGLGQGSPPMRLPRRGSKAKRMERWFADEHGFFHTPIFAMVLNAAITCIYIVIGDFTTLTTFYGVASYLFYFAAVVGLIVLRVKEPELERPYKCWIVTPVVFCCVSLFLLSRAIFAKPLQAVVVFAFIAAGLPLYWWQVGRRRRRNNGKRVLVEGDGWKFWKRWTRP
ncbi:amino acid permease-domain-containing protein [Neohortaea acidophila]|uniref:Amino acid permease-domain-containing protein n=1 Tax=Neohortaea acidophila TaxID=245834 RepID=A0A6A6PFU2_9PEZI|nr:amino acid permease-domain-containing protein [Neohortaea acidophila]KAF2478591.1 amino acid permease-domain-containing protein [Neohortaea acidophila]